MRLSHTWWGACGEHCAWFCCILMLLLKPPGALGGVYFSRAQVPCAPDRSVHLIPLGLKCVADIVSQHGSTVGAAAGSGSRICFLGPSEGYSESQVWSGWCLLLLRFLRLCSATSHHPNPGTVELGAWCLCWLLSSFVKNNSLKNFQKDST